MSAWRMRSGNGRYLRQRDPVRHQAGTGRVRQQVHRRGAHVQDGVAAIPALHLGIAAHRRPHQVKRHETLRPEQRPPVFRRLFVDMVLAPLPRHGGGKQHPVGMRHQRGHEPGGARLRQVFGRLQALHQIEAPPQVDRRGEIGRLELGPVDQQPGLVDIGSVDAMDLNAGFLPDAQPGAMAAAEIGDAACSGGRQHHRHHAARRAHREAGQKRIEIIAILVHRPVHPPRRYPIPISQAGRYDLAQRAVARPGPLPDRPHARRRVVLSTPVICPHRSMDRPSLAARRRVPACTSVLARARHDRSLPQAQQAPSAPQARCPARQPHLNQRPRALAPRSVGRPPPAP